LAVIRHVDEVSGNLVMSCWYFAISGQSYYTCPLSGRGRRGSTRPFAAPKACPNAVYVEAFGKIIHPWQN